MLIVLQGELNAINDEQKYYEKLRVKHSNAAEKKLKEEKDFEKLLEISKQQKEQIIRITREIQTLRLKIKSQNQFLLNERPSQTHDLIKPQILSFPSYVSDVCENSSRTQSTFTSKTSTDTKIMASDAKSNESVNSDESSAH